MSASMIGPYELLGELGAGGMGVVYRARHTELGREVALKVIALGSGSSSSVGGDGDPDSTDAGMALVARFEREAAAAGRLSGHPNIVAVHDLGRAGDRIYLAMDLIEGRPLDALITEGELTAQQSVGLVAQIAEALAHAHDAGVLHRDVKPSNILVRNDGTALLADFGLAQRHSADPDVTRLTKSGELLGTPAYMPPEQARGEGVDGRADVYALGATLYDCLVGAPPFPGDSMFRVIAGVLREEPRPPRTLRPELPRELDAVVLRCLEKKPADRYASAGAMAEDLRRFLAGRPIVARRRGWGSRGVRWLRAHRRSAALAAGTLALIAGAGTIAWQLSRNTETTTGKLQHETAQLTAAERAGRVSTAWLTLQRDSGEAMRTLEDRAQGADVSREAADHALAQIRAVVERVRRASPDVHAVDGWLALALVWTQQPDDAKRLFEGAVRGSDPAIDPFPRLLRARLELGRYVKLMQTPSLSIGSDSVRLGDLIESKEMVAARTFARSDLEAIPATVWGRLQSAAGDRAFADGAGAVAARRWEAALDALAPLRDDPALSAAAGMLGGLAAFQSARFIDAAARWEAAGERGWPRAIELAALAHLAESIQAEARGEDPTARLQRAAGQLESAAPRLKDARWALLNLASTQVVLGNYRAGHGQDGTPDIRLGIATLDRLMQIDAEWVTAWAQRAVAFGLLAHADRKAGRDPRTNLELALADYGRCTEIDADYTTGWSGRALTWQQVAHYAGQIGAKAGAFYDRALRDVHQAITLQPKRVVFHTMLGNIHADRARWLMENGGNPGADYAAALRALATATELATGAGVERRERARILHERSMWAEQTGEDRIPWLDQAVAEYGVALRSNPRDVPALSGRADSLHQRARSKDRMGGGDPEPDFLAALRDYDAALEINARSGRIYNNRGYACSDLARLTLKRGGDPSPWFTKALADYTAALDIQPNNNDAWVNRGNLLFDRAEYGAARGADPTSDLLASEQAQNEAIRLNPREVNAFQKRGEVHQLRARWTQAAGGDPMPHLTRATRDYASAIALNPTDMRLRNARCIFFQDVAEIVTARGGDPRPHLRAAIADIDTALARNPNYIFGYINRANACNTIAELERRDGGDWQRWYRQSYDAAKRATVLNPTSWNAVMMRGYTADRLGMNDEAITYYERALKMRDHAGIRANYELLRKRLGR